MRVITNKAITTNLCHGCHYFSQKTILSDQKTVLSDLKRLLVILSFFKSLKKYMLSNISYNWL